MTQNVYATLPQGRVRGLRQGAVSRYSAIPYAEPPVGELRFAPPRPFLWQGELDARLPGPVAPQLPSRLEAAMGGFRAAQAEDCLHLTVWTPAADEARRPVVLWVHGGAWQSGGVLPWYDGARLAAEGDIVVVAVNYRLGALGWQPLPGGTANAGLLDLELAIDWVHDHIAAFGGDASALTVMGQSAGASNLIALLTRQPRFSRAILQSAALGRGWRSAEDSARLGRALYAACGIESLSHARALPAAAWLQAGTHPAVLLALQEEGQGRSLAAPVCDGEILPRDMNAALTRAQAHCDVLVSYTRDEMAAFPGHDRHSQAETGRLFGQPARDWASAAAAHGRQSWLARFDVGPSERFGACHCIELPFTFGTLDTYANAPMLAGLSPAAGQALSQRVRQAWIAFIRGGSPGWAPAPQEEILA
ncbi:carboxylesterase family protein [Bordetella trematum]|uniref:carboxylesterase family protein n=1 Tax=Bordetella trematum TaxID=123899 RepID=UPI003D0C03EA